MILRILTVGCLLPLALVISSPGNAETIASACKAPNGTLYNFSDYRASPPRGCSRPGSTVVRLS